MRKFVTAVAVIALAAIPVFASQTPAPSSSASKAAPKTSASKSSSMATHSTSGVVKSMDATTLVITKSGKKPEEMTFAVSASTQKQGTPDVGSAVTVRYKTEGTTNTATAIVAKPAHSAAKK